MIVATREVILCLLGGGTGVVLFYMMIVNTNDTITASMTGNSAPSYQTSGVARKLYHVLQIFITWAGISSLFVPYLMLYPVSTIFIYLTTLSCILSVIWDLDIRHLYFSIWFNMRIVQLNVASLINADDSRDKRSKGYILELCNRNGELLQYLPSKYQNDRDVVIVACNQNGIALRYAAMSFREDHEVVLVACQQNGQALSLADPCLRKNKDIVLAAVSSEPESLKYAMEGLNQDSDCLIASRLWDEKYHGCRHRNQQVYCNPGPIGRQNSPKRILRTTDHVKAITNNIPNATTLVSPRLTRKRIVLSTKFSLHEEASSVATKFTILLKQHPYIQSNNFKVYSPNAYDKGTCDPHWTRKEWPCRGTYDTCQMNDPKFKVGVPTNNSCWRYSFRHQLEQAKRTDGFMIQLVELCSDSAKKQPVRSVNSKCVKKVDIYYPRQNVECLDSNDHNDDTAYFVADEEYSLGKGQAIETEMARDVGIKVFRVYQPSNYLLSYDLTTMMTELDHSHIEKVVSQIKHCYENDVGPDRQCRNTSTHSTVKMSTSLLSRVRMNSGHIRKLVEMPTGSGRVPVTTTDAQSCYYPAKEFFILEND